MGFFEKIRGSRVLRGTASQRAPESQKAPVSKKSKQSLVSRTLRLAIIRIGLVSICAGVISYFINRYSIEEAVRTQLLLSAEQTLQREALPFREIRELEQNFLAEFMAIDSDPVRRQELARDFDKVFYRHPDGSYTQRPGLFEGNPLPDGRRFPNMSATYAPDIPPNDDVKARFMLSYLLSHKYGSATLGRLFNFYGVVPEKGFPIYQSSDIAKVFTYSGQDALKLETYEFYARGFSASAHETFVTKMYFDYSNNAWMTTVATPDVPDANGRHRILACVDVLLDELMRRLAHPAIQGAYSMLFMADEDGTLMFHPKYTDEIKKSEGAASIRSLGMADALPLLEASRSLMQGKVVLVDTVDEIVAVGRLPETPGVLAIHYPRELIRPAILQNLAIVVALGLLTLVVEVFIIRSILQEHVAQPLERLIRAMRMLGSLTDRKAADDLTDQYQDEIGELAYDFVRMAERVQDVQAQLESEVQERTAALEVANRKLVALSVTDDLTGVANRRCFDEMLDDEWRRAKRAGSYLVLAMIDVDWFKNYNDHYGHQAGDQCLRNVASIVDTLAQRSGDCFARYGGEEFGLIVTSTAPDKVQQFAEAICRAVATAEMPHEMSPLGVVTISIGLAGVVPAGEAGPESLLKQADSALYQAKAQGRNRAVVAG